MYRSSIYDALGPMSCTVWCAARAHAAWRVCQLIDAVVPPLPAPQPAQPLSESDDKLWASLAHFGGVLFILPSLVAVVMGPAIVMITQSFGGTP